MNAHNDAAAKYQCALHDWHVKQRESDLDPQVKRVDVAALDADDCAGPLDFAGQLAACLLPEASAEDRRAKSQQIIDDMLGDIKEGKLLLRRPGTGEVDRRVGVSESAVWLLSCVLRKSEFLAWARKVGFSIPPGFTAREAADNTSANARLSHAEVTEAARKIAQDVGDRRWASGMRQITARGVDEAVAIELGKDPRMWGKRGPRSSSSVRTEMLKSWKYVPPKTADDGLNGLKPERRG